MLHVRMWFQNAHFCSRVGVGFIISPPNYTHVVDLGDLVIDCGMLVSLWGSCCNNKHSRASPALFGHAKRPLGLCVMNTDFDDSPRQL